MYFGENDSEKNPDVLDSEPKKGSLILVKIFIWNKLSLVLSCFLLHLNFLDNNIEYEKVIMDIISKRRQGTKVCKDVLEKTLHLERKTVVG